MKITGHCENKSCKVLAMTAMFDLFADKDKNKFSPFSLSVNHFNSFIRTRAQLP